MEEKKKSVNWWGLIGTTILAGVSVIGVDAFMDFLEYRKEQKRKKAEENVLSKLKDILRGTVVQYKGETDEEYKNRLRKIIKNYRNVVKENEEILGPLGAYAVMEPIRIICDDYGL